MAVHVLAVPDGDGSRRCLLLALEADGLRGLGEAVGPDLAAVGTELRERRPRRPEARAAWAAAELDLAARAAGVPAAALLGGRRRSRVRCARRLTAVSPGQVAREVERAAAAAFRTFDLPAVAGGGPLDLERLGAARWAAAGARVRLHLSGAAPPERLLHTLAAFRPALVVDPLPAAAGPDAWLRLAAASPVPLAASPPDAGLAAALVAAGMSLAVDPAGAGPAAACDLARLAAGRPVLVRSTPATVVGLAAAVHLACGLDAEPLDCSLAVPGPLDAGVAGWPAAARGPWLALPDGPGLGVDVDPRALARYEAAR